MIALEAGIAGGTHIILVPEIPFTVESVCEFEKKRESYGKRFTIAVVAEGVNLPPELKDNRRAGSVGNLIGNAIAVRSRKEVRVSVLGHIQRGGSPTPFDRILATRFGVAAVDLIAQRGFGKMICLRNARIEAGHRPGQRPDENRGSRRSVGADSWCRPPGRSAFPSETSRATGWNRIE
jgi:ATP-dependent phosphofructokinase / diphosphate-dependent phosphofructokinase